MIKLLITLVLSVSYQEPVTDDYVIFDLDQVPYQCSIISKYGVRTETFDAEYECVGNDELNVYSNWEEWLCRQYLLLEEYGAADYLKLKFNK